MVSHSDEIAKRKNFQSKFEGHFLSQLFPGLEDLPPAFAIKAPSTFDHNLPKVLFYHQLYGRCLHNNTCDCLPL